MKKSEQGFRNGSIGGLRNLGNPIMCNSPLEVHSAI